MKARMIKLAVCIGLPLVVWMLPSEALQIPGITVVEHRMVAIFLFAVLAWVLEPIPIFATGVMVIVLELMLLSEKAPKFLRPAAEDPAFGVHVPYKSIMGTMAQPIIMLFLGGFFLALAATKYKLDRNLARVLLKPFGTKPKFVMLGLMLITAVFSMFMSNTATTALMLTLLMPVVGLLPEDDPGRISFALAIPFAANIGGIGTPIGTPPNAVAMGYLKGEIAVSFGTWMAFALPYVIVALAAVWLVLQKLYPPRLEALKIEIKDRFDQSGRAIIVYVTFVVTIGLWLSGSVTGMNSYVIAMIPVGVFTACGIVTAAELRSLNWDVLWLVAGGIALGLGLEKTGLSDSFVAAIPFDRFSPCVVIAVAALIATGLASFMSNTAAAALLLPVLAAIGSSSEAMLHIGGAKGLVITSTIACSLGMILPVSTPPNALAYASGLFETKHMLKAGLIVAGLSLALLSALAYILSWVGFFHPITGTG